MSTHHGRTGAGNRKTPPQTFDLVRALVRKIAVQFPDTGEGRLMLSVLAASLNDLITNRQGTEIERYRDAAKDYLNGDIWHAQICGIDPDWIRHVLRRAGIEFGEKA